MGLSRVINEQANGKLETNVQTVDMGGVKIEKDVDARYSRSMAKSEVGNPITNLREIQWRKKDLSPSSNVRKAQNYSEKGR